MTYRYIEKLQRITSFTENDMRVYPKVSELVAWSDNCKWYNSLPLGAVV